MVLPECLSMTDSDKCDALALHVAVQVALYINTHGTSALIQYGILRTVIYKSSHGDSLLFTSGKHIVPVIVSIPATFAAY